MAEQSRITINAVLIRNKKIEKLLAGHIHMYMKINPRILNIGSWC